MIKTNGKEVPVMLYKFYMHDYLTEIIEYLKPALECKTNTELFSKVLMHVYGEMKQFEDWQNKKDVQKEVKNNE